MLQDNPVLEDGSCYLPSDNLMLAVRVAQAIGRPLLLYGRPGSGKSSLARYIAYSQGLRYYEHVTTSRTQARDLLWSYDSVRRLSDAQMARDLKPDFDYVSPGALWWAFDQGSAQDRGGDPFANWNSEPERDGHGAVVLVDEIDKADPDLPNGLLVPLSARRFVVTDVKGGYEVKEKQPSVIVITSNEERDLPQAFERRCVVYRIPAHGDRELREITDRHLARHGKTVSAELLGDLLARFEKSRMDAGRDGRRKPSTAEFLDAVLACAALEKESVSRILSMIFEKASHE